MRYNWSDEWWDDKMIRPCGCCKHSPSWSELGGSLGWRTWVGEPLLVAFLFKVAYLWCFSLDFLIDCIVFVSVFTKYISYQIHTMFSFVSSVSAILGTCDLRDIWKTSAKGWARCQSSWCLMVVITTIVVRFTPRLPQKRIMVSQTDNRRQSPIPK